MKNIPYRVPYAVYLTNDKSQVSEGEQHVKNEEIDESHKSQIKF